MMMGILVFIAAGFVAVGLLGGSSLFYGQTIKSGEKIDQIEFTVVENSGSTSANVTVYLVVENESKRLRDDGQVILNGKEIEPEFYNGMSVGYRYVAEAVKAESYNLKIRNQDETFERRLLSARSELVLPTTLDRNIRFVEVKLPDQDGVPGLLYVELKSNDLPEKAIRLKLSVHDVPEDFPEAANLRVSQTFVSRDGKYVLVSRRDVKLIGLFSQ